MSREVTLYTRKDCGLCDETAAVLRRLQDQLAFSVRSIDIDTDEALRAEYTDVIPVVAVGERVVAHAPIDPDELRVALATALR